MNISDIKEYIEIMLRKHKSGNSLSPKEFNYLIKSENYNFFNDKVKEIQGLANTPEEFRQLILSNKILRPFVSSQSITPTTGVYALTSLTNTFSYWISALTNAAFNGSIKRIDLITHDNLVKRQTNLLMPPIKYYPVAVIEGSNLKIYPTNITSLTLTYLKLPKTPVYDYYIDTSKNDIFMASGSSHTIATGEVGSAGETTGTLNSATTDPEYTQETYPEFIEYLLLKIATRGERQFLAQQTEREQIKDKL